MPRITLNEELELIASIVASHPAGVGISALEAEMEHRLGTPPQRRTLQRRLLKLIEEQRLVTEGESIVLVYKLAVGAVALNALSAAGTASTALEVAQTERVAPEKAAPEPAEAEVDLEVPLSPEGAAIATQVRRAPMYRRPIGYQLEFLHAYQPGETFYLPEPTRRQLHQIGRTPQSGQPAGTYARDILGRLRVDWSWASSRLEGNSYRRPDAQNLIELGRIAQGQDAIETQMLLNHQAAIEMLIPDADELALDAFTFKNLHAVLSQDLLPDPRASGRLRQRPVELAGTVFEPLAVPEQLEDCFALLLHKATAIPEPFEQAFFLLVQLPYLQPFDDANQRVSRLGANIPLLKHNLCPLSFIDVPQRAYAEATLGVYELNDVALLRDLFVWAYERSCQHYLAMTQTMVAPDPLKIQYRDALMQAVQTIVQGGQQPSPSLVAQLAQEYAPPAHRMAFAEMLTEALQQLHEGSIARYRLRRSDYLAWQQARLPARP
ncbi:Fic family protein [Simplicispira psychrophila]|uniref:Fic family protein n=1 Tax=Simplicispira psychrophila TaxID=80882 RepID=UPI00048772B2|nr:Fic family protein [Simplicispira psychrophila]